MRVEDVNWKEVIDEAKFNDVQMHRGRRMAYVLFGAIENPRDNPKPTLVTLNAGANHAQAGVIDHYVFNRGFKILKWWFPTSEAYAARVKGLGNNRADSYMEMAPGAWDMLDNHCRQLTGKDVAIDTLKGSVEALQAKVREYEEADRKKGGAK
jgi:hypothetical protein